MHFSSLAKSLTDSKNPLYVLHDELHGAGHSVVNLVSGNVNEHGIVFPQERLQTILAAAADRARVYRPDSLGQEAAREAISAYYGGSIPPRQILLTPGTSISYWYCFKLLAEPGDEILTPRPSYPLFDYIAAVCGVQLTHYRLREERSWAIDLDDLEAQISTKTRAIVLISPHNPTGMVADHSQLTQLAEIAVRHRLPIISDEVFSEFLFGLSDLPRPAATAAPLVFTLNGFSKMFALPGMKIGWIAVSGDVDLAAKSLSALELISDTFLPVNEIAQCAAAEVFSNGQDFLASYRRWIADCRTIALEELRHCRFVAPQGGFYITLQITDDEEQSAAGLLRSAHVLVHPGFFYDIRPDHLVMTFIQEHGALRDAYRKIAAYIASQSQP